MGVRCATSALLHCCTSRRRFGVVGMCRHVLGQGVLWKADDAPMMVVGVCLCACMCPCVRAACCVWLPQAACRPGASCYHPPPFRVGNPRGISRCCGSRAPRPTRTPHPYPHPCARSSARLPSGPLSTLCGAHGCAGGAAGESEGAARGGQRRRGRRRPWLGWGPGEGRRGGSWAGVGRGGASHPRLAVRLPRLRGGGAVAVVARTACTGATHVTHPYALTPKLSAASTPVTELNSGNTAAADPLPPPHPRFHAPAPTPFPRPTPHPWPGLPVPDVCR